MARPRKSQQALLNLFKEVVMKVSEEDARVIAQPLLPDEYQSRGLELFNHEKARRWDDACRKFPDLHDLAMFESRHNKFEEKAHIADAILLPREEAEGVLDGTATSYENEPEMLEWISTLKAMINAYHRLPLSEMTMVEQARRMELTGTIEGPGAVSQHGFRGMADNFDEPTRFKQMFHESAAIMAKNEPAGLAMELKSMRDMLQAAYLVLRKVHRSEIDAVAEEEEMVALNMLMTYFTDREPVYFDLLVNQAPEPMSLNAKIGRQYKPDEARFPKEKAAALDKARLERLNLPNRLKQALDANKVLQDKLRTIRDNRESWTKYADNLEKRLTARDALLKQHNIPVAGGYAVGKHHNDAIIQEHPLGAASVFQGRPRVPPSESSATTIAPSSSISRVDAVNNTRSASPERPSSRFKALQPSTASRIPGDSEQPSNATTPAMSIGNPEGDTVSSAQQHRRSILFNSPKPAVPDDLVRRTLRPFIISGSQISDDENEGELPPLPALLKRATIPDSQVPTSSSAPSPAKNTSALQAEIDAQIASTQVVPDEAEVQTDPISARDPTDDDVPMMVSERQLRKRKARDSPQKLRVKTEHLSSSPVAFLGLNHMESHESMDLDDVGIRTATPKKRMTRSGAIISQASGLQQSYVPANDHPLRQPVFRTAEREDVEMAAEPATPFVAAPAPATSALQPQNSNKAVRPQATNPRSTRKRRAGEMERGAALFAEDGQETPVPKPTAPAASSSTIRNLPGVESRLANLLENPTPARKTSATKPAKKKPRGRNVEYILDWEASDYEERKAAEAAERQAEIDEMNRPRSPGEMKRLEEEVIAMAEQTRKEFEWKHHPDNPDNTIYKKKGTRKPGRPRKAAQPRIEEHGSDAVDVPENEPLRLRPLSRLSLDDFKINPAANGGENFAYNSVVRKKADRKCLAGCTKPSCCGPGFRALAEISNPEMNNRTLSQEEADNELIKDFLGARAGMLATMSKEQRRELLLQAKTRELSNKVARHRNQYERRASPPGFWRADFPTTQEQAEDREKAKEFERNLVRERYEEAMREGGKYIFRDE